LTALHDAFNFVINYHHIDRGNPVFSQTMAKLQSIDSYIRSYQRFEFITQLASKGIKIDCYGNNSLKNIPEQINANLDFHQPVDFSETLHLMNQAKLVLNLLPHFTEGTHERVFSAMLNKTTCVSNTSSYLEEEFRDGTDIIFYDILQLDNLVEKIHYYLSHIEELKVIADNGFQKAHQHHTWKERAKEIIKLVIDYKKTID
jgi:spore maturation protein CgeB